MSRIEKTIYDAEYFEGLSRSQIQQHAKVGVTALNLDIRILTSSSSATWHQGK